MSSNSHGSAPDIKVSVLTSMNASNDYLESGVKKRAGVAGAGIPSLLRVTAAEATHD